VDVFPGHPIICTNSAFHPSLSLLQRVPSPHASCLAPRVPLSAGEQLLRSSALGREDFRLLEQLCELLSVPTSLQSGGYPGLRVSLTVNNLCAPISTVLILVSHFQGIAGADGLPGDKGELVGVLKFRRKHS